MTFFMSRNGRFVVLACVAAGLSVFLVAILVRSPPQGPPKGAGDAAAESAAQTEANEESPRRIINQFGMEFVEIPPGGFVMGSLRGKADEQPHVVHITRPFFLGVTEVTGWEMSEIGIAAGKWSPELRVTRRRNRERSFGIASWQEATQLAATLSQVDPDYNYRLPTEAEWEYACRAEVDVVEPAEDDAEVSQPYREGFGAIDLVKLVPPNAFGLYDMLRNNGEYCSDWYGADYYEHSPLEDPRGPTRGTGKVARGVGYGAGGSFAAWRRYTAQPQGDGNILIGVRFVLEEEKAK